VLTRVKGLRKQHEAYEVIEEEYKKERLQLEKTFLQRKEALWKQRESVLKSESEINEEGVITKSEGKKEGGSENAGIPSFWLTCLSSHPMIGELVTQEDVPALESLMNITCDYDEGFTEFTLTFHFTSNEFFTNTLLTKKYSVSPDLLDDKSPALMKIEGTTIEWKAPDKNLCVKEISKKQKAKSGRNKGQVRTVTRSVPKPSFFHYFDERAEGDEEEDEAEEQNQDEDQEGRIKLNLDEDYDIGHTIRTSIIPEAILWFTGEAEMDDGLFGDDGDYDEEEGDDVSFLFSLFAYFSDLYSFAFVCLGGR
jgi:nucleosome assembly protein 1-like 1